MTQDNYFGRKVAQTGAAGILEIFGGDEVDPNPGGKLGLDHDPEGASGS
jgi:hypothetical protein